MNYTCSLCGILKSNISSSVGICATCLREASISNIDHIIQSQHSSARKPSPLPSFRPNAENGVKCRICVAECKIEDGKWGWCGIHGNERGKIRHKYLKDHALLSWYLDAQVTNCCNAWFCPAGTGCGYPKWANEPGPETGYYNMALFFYGCSFNCLFCQNWQHKDLKSAKLTSIDDIVQSTINNPKISCWCWFGGSPEPQMSFTFKAQKQLLEEKSDDHIVRFCYEWNGDANPNLAIRAAQYSCDSGGNIKFDVKAWDPVIHTALTGMDNKRVLSNITNIYDKHWEHRSSENPMLGFSTLLIPYYVDTEEVEEIAKFLADLDPNLPYSLLIFHPDFVMNDLPITPQKQVKECEMVAKKYLNRVNIGNKHLLAFSI